MKKEEKQALKNKHKTEVSQYVIQALTPMRAHTLRGKPTYTEVAFFFSFTLCNSCIRIYSLGNN